MIEKQSIPQNWSVMRVKDIGEVITGNTPPKNNIKNYGTYIPFVKPPELTNGAINSAMIIYLKQVQKYRG